MMGDKEKFRAFCTIMNIKEEIIEKLEEVRGNNRMEDIYKNQLKIVNRCINVFGSVEYEN